MKKLNFKWLLLSFILSIASVNTAWGTKTAIPANTVIYVDITNFHDDSHTENNATDSKYYISQPNYYNVTNNRSTSASSSSGAGDYWPAGDSTWLELSVVSGNIYCAKTTSKWYDGNISFWTKDESSYANVWQACVALLQEYDGANNLYTISSGSNYHDSRNATCFGTDVSVMPTFTTGATLYLNADTYWDVSSALFRAYFFNGVTSTWATCEQVGSSHYYSVTVPAGSWTHVIFVRKDPATNVEDSWTGKWNQTSDMAPSGTNNCVNITAAGNNNQSWGKYTPNPAIAGTMNNWAVDVNVMSGGSVSIKLDGGKAYAFQVVSGATWYGSPDSQYKITCVGQDQTFNPTASDKHILLLTAGDGFYTFHWDGTDLTIDYPTVTHPSTDYVYFTDNYDWHEYYFTTHLWGGETGTTWETLPVLTAFNFDGTDYYYTALGGNTTGLVSKGSTSSDDEKTADLSLSSHMGQWYNVVNKTEESSEVDENWNDFTATLTLDHQSATNTPAPNTITVTYGASTNLTGDVITTTPAKGGYYTFGGYYTEKGGEGNQFIAANETVNANVTNYTDGSKNWIKTGSSVSTTIYAKWTQNIMLDREGGTTGDESLAATYNAVLSTGGLTLPTRAGYDFAGYWTGDDGTGSMVINASGVVQTVASWTDGSKKWIHEGASTLHAKWTEVELTFDNNSGAGNGNWNVAANWNPECVPTSGHDVTIGAEVTVNVNDAAAKSVAFSSGGKLTIPATGALKVEGTISNTTAANIVINSNGSNQGALIFNNSAGATCATVTLTTQYTGSGKFQYIAIPIYYLSVSSKFAGEGVYTYVWKNSTGEWERRGYYDDLSAFEAIALSGQSSTTFSGALVSTADKEYTLTYNGSTTYGDINMFGNSWTAPIKVGSLTLDDTSDKAVHLWDGNNGRWDGGIAKDVIPAMQAFAVITKSGGGSLTINYSAVRDVTSANRTELLKAPKRYTSEDPEPIIVYVSGNDLQSRIRLFEDEQFSDELDNGWEALYMEGEGRAGDLYAIGTDKMNVLATSNLEGTVVGFVPGEATDYTISFAGDGKGYYLNDMKTGESTLIDEANTYDFTSDESTNAKRFVISKTPMMPTGVDEVADGSNARKQLIDGTLYIIRDGRIYNAEGAVVK